MQSGNYSLECNQLANDKFTELAAAYNTQLECSPRYATSTNAHVSNQLSQAAQSYTTGDNVAHGLVGNYSNGYGSYQGYYPYTNSYQTVYVDKTQKAFTIAKKLMDKDLVQCDTVKQFITLIDLLVGTL